MAIGKCRECGKEADSEAKTCPHCGVKAPLVAHPILKGIGGVLIFVFAGWIVLQVAADYNKEATLRAHQQEIAAAVESTPMPVSAFDLFAEYSANEVAADERFKGKVLAVKGRVQNISKDFANVIWVGMQTQNKYMPIRLSGISQAEAIKLKPNDIITATCVGGGVIMGSPILKCDQ